MDLNEKNKLGFVTILASGFFLFNPIVAFVDVLPNCIGYLLLCVGLRYLADLSGYITDALRRFRILLLLSIGQALVTYLIYGVMRNRATEMNPYEIPVYILLASFVLLVLQCYFLIPAFKDLFLGIEQLAQRHQAVELTREKKGKSVAEQMISFSSFFVIVSSLCAVLPELTVLTSFEHDVENRLFPFDWYEYVGAFRILFAFLSALIAIVWLYRWIRICLSAVRDQDWMHSLRETYRTQVLPQSGMLSVRRFQTVLFLLQIALVFSVNLRMSYRSVLPGFVLAILCAGALILLGSLISSEKKKVCYVACGFLFVASIAEIVLNDRYLRTFLPEASLHEPDAYYAYLTVRAVDAIEAVLSCLLIAVLFSFLWDIVQSKTGVDYGSRQAVYLSSDATARLHRSFKTRLTVTFVFFAIAAVFNVLDALFRLDYPWIWLIAFVFSFVAIYSASSVFHELKLQLQAHYQSDGVNKNL